MPQNNWIAPSGSSWSVAADWSLGTVPTFADNVVFASGFSNFGCTVNQAAEVASIVTSGTYGGALTFAGQTLTSSGNVTLDGSGTLNLGNGVTCNGASSNFHIGSTVGTVTATSCVLTMNTATAGVIDDDKGITFKSLTLGANAVVTVSSSAQSIFSSATTPLTIGDNASLINNAIIRFYLSGSAAFHSLGTGSTIAGSGTFRWYLNASSITGTFPAYTYTGTGVNEFRVAGLFTSSTWQLTGAFNSGTNRLDCYNDSSSATVTFDANGQNVTCGLMAFGCNAAASASFIANLSTGTYSITSFRGDIYNTAGSPANTIAINLQTSQWTCTGNWTFGSNHNIDPGTSIVNITNTSSVTSNTNPFYDFNVNTAASGTLVTFTGSPRISGDFTVTQGSTNLSNLNWSGYGDILFDGTGNHTIGSGITLMNAGTFRLNSLLSSCVSAGCYVKCNENATLTLDGRTLNRLGLTTGKTYTWTTGTSVPTINTYTAGDWDGTTLVSSTPTSQWKLKMVPAITVNSVTVTDSDNSTGTQIDATAGTNVDGGHNLNWLFTSGPAPSGIAVELTEIRFYNPFLHKYYVAKNNRVLRAVQRYIG